MIPGLGLPWTRVQGPWLRLPIPSLTVAGIEKLDKRRLNHPPAPYAINFYFSARHICALKLAPSLLETGK